MPPGGKIGNKGGTGRPLLFKTPADLQRAVDHYFFNCDLTGEMPLITGLALALNTNRATIKAYRERPDFTGILSRANAICEHHWERILYGGQTSAAAPIFALKNYGWTDKQELQISGDSEEPLAWDITVHNKNHNGGGKDNG